MGKRGKRGRHSCSAAPTAGAICKDGGVTVTSNETTIEAWPSNVFEEPLKNHCSIQSDLHQFWLTLEQRKRCRLTPTPIQLRVWPIMLGSRQNVVGIAPTSSGKTLAYGLPLARNGNSLILVPTRELAKQVERELMPLSNKRVICIYGGVDRDFQVAALKKKGSWIVAATPGRLVDILNDDDSKPLAVDSVVLDEGDRMASNVDMARQVDEILSRLRPETTTPIRVCIFSATYPTQIEKKWSEWVGQSRVCVKVNTMTIGKESENLDVTTQRKVEIDAVETSTTTCHDQNALNFSRIPAHVSQILHVCAAHKKPRKLVSTLQKIRKDEGRQKGLCLVFFARIKTLQYIHNLLNQEGYKSAQFHGNLNQSMRETTLVNFKSGKMPTMLATDIAARGIHVNNIEYVINYDFPCSLDQYVHRCGRAGRNQGSTATVYSFFTRELAPMAKDVLALLEFSKAWIDPNLLELVGTKGGSPKRKRGRQEQNAVEDDIEAFGDGPDAIDDEDWDDGQFANLCANRIVLKRASHVSDASESESESNEERGKLHE